MEIKDVTNEVTFELNDDENLPLTKCVCGKEFTPWTFILNLDTDDFKVCPACGRALYFDLTIKVYEIKEKK